MATVMPRLSDVRFYHGFEISSTQVNRTKRVAEFRQINLINKTMDSYLKSTECNCRTHSTTSTSLGCKPQNKYLCYLLDEFEKCSQQSNDLNRLQKVR